MTKQPKSAPKSENDFWDLEEQQLSLTNMEAELGRLKSGEKLDLLNVGFEELQILFQGLSILNGGLDETLRKMRDQMDKRTNEILDAINRQNNPLHPYQPSPATASWTNAPSSGVGGYNSGGYNSGKI